MYGRLFACDSFHFYRFNSMRKHILAALLALPCLAQAQAPFTCTVKGQLGRTLNAPAKIYLSRGFEITDSATLKNGAFELKEMAEVPTIADLILRRNGRLRSLVGPPGDRARIYLEPGTVTIASSDSLAHATIKGGPTMMDYLRLDAIPQNFLVGPDGKIAAVNLRGEALGATLAQFIK